MRSCCWLHDCFAVCKAVGVCPYVERLPVQALAQHTASVRHQQSLDTAGAVLSNCLTRDQPLDWTALARAEALPFTWVMQCCTCGSAAGSAIALTVDLCPSTPQVVLVNRNTASTGELLAGALRG